MILPWKYSLGVILIFLPSISSKTTPTKHTHQNVPTFVERGLWLGGIKDVELDKRISTVDCRFCPLSGNRFHDRSPNSWERVEENISTLRYLARCIRQRRGGNKELFVYCWKGQNRSPASLAAYFMIYEGLTLTQAFTKIKISRPESKTWDNTFILELKEIAKEHPL